MNRVCCPNATKLAYKKVTHVIFDLDGLLLDTECLYTKATQTVVAEFGKTYDYSVKVQVMGLTGVEAAKKLVSLLDLPISWEEYYELAKTQYALVMPKAELLPDTESIYLRVFSDIAKQHGKVYTPEIRAKVIGTLEATGAEIAVREMKLPMSSQQFLTQYRSMAQQSLIKVGLMPGAERLVRHFHSMKVPIAVATSSAKDSYDLKVQRHLDLFSLFNHVVTGGSDLEVKHGKPSPDIFLICASRFKDKPAPEQCLVFEDAPNGVQAAVGAGMQVVMVPDKQTSEELCKQATLKLNSLEEIKPELFGLPPFKTRS
ncbi:HAD 2 and/or Hydrolase domain containing protein [Asbolus verrucosus]|uniref:pseudouridine 5'-phosphatase n=1 Tax=Asbolus verrucosus TaxID=1661398 RepID=A0A482VMB9_ASBVE|nr:HAD 2 and/or Hydrolase domain containing protein [Asbolus verrucosus]